MRRSVSRQMDLKNGRFRFRENCVAYFLRLLQALLHPCTDSKRKKKCLLERMRRGLVLQGKILSHRSSSSFRIF